MFYMPREAGECVMCGTFLVWCRGVVAVGDVVEQAGWRWSDGRGPVPERRRDNHGPRALLADDDRPSHFLLLVVDTHFEVSDKPRPEISL